MPKRRRVKKSFKLLFIMLVLITGILGGYFVYRKITLIPKANTVFVYDLLEDKNVFVTRSGDIDKAYRGMRLHEDDRLYTDSSSKVYIKLDDNKNVLLDYSSEIIIERYKNNELVIKLVKGQFFFDVTSKLQVNETMKFKIANTTMSIRGTSGAGKNEYGHGQFSIYSGKGEIESLNGSNMSTFTLMPATKVSYLVENDVTVSDLEVSIVNESDIPSVMYDYLNYESKYLDELNDNNWSNTNPPLNLEGKDYIGWRQKEDGTWYFSNEDFALGIGPTPYKISKPLNLEVEDSIYNGKILRPVIKGFNENFMIVEAPEKKDAGIYDIAIKPRTSWADGTRDSIILKWTIKPKDLNLLIDNVRKEYKSKDPEFTSTISGLLDDDKFEYKLVREEGEDLGDYKIYPKWDVEKYPNYNPVYEDAYLSIYTTFNVSPKENKYTYPYDGFYNGPDDPVETSDENGTTIKYSLDGINYVNEPIKVIDAGNYIVHVKATNPRYTYEPECKYEIEITKTKVEAKATGYYDQRSIDMIAEVQVPPGVEYTAAYYLYEINDYKLNREKATLISRIVANGTYVAYPQIQILDGNFIPKVKYTKVTVKSMLFHIFSNDYYDDINSLLKTYSQE